MSSYGTSDDDYSNRLLCHQPRIRQAYMLMEEGKKLTTKMWEACKQEQGCNVAQAEYGGVMEHTYDVFCSCTWYSRL